MARPEKRIKAGVVSKGEKKIGINFQEMSNTVPCFKEIW
jgi:hypothetical protein